MDYSTKRRAPRTNRRDFCHTCLWLPAAPYLVRASVLGRGGQLPPSERIHTALIGAGSRGQQILAGGDRVVAVCDVDRQHREAAKNRIDAAAGNQDCAAYLDYRHLLNREDVDAVVIATPDHWHVPMTAAAVRAGKAVFVEKPLSLFINEGRELAQLVQRYQAIVQVGSQQRSFEYARFRRACEWVRNGYLGQLRTVEVQILARRGSDRPWQPQPVPEQLDYERWLGPAPWSPYHPARVHYHFRFVSDYSGGDLTNWGAHHLDIAQWGLGADDSGPLHVVGQGRRNPSGLHDVFADIHVDYRFPGGVSLRLRSSEQAGTGSVRFIGSEGWIHVSREDFSSNPPSLLNARLGPRDLRLGPVEHQDSHMANWLRCVRNRDPRGLNCPVEIGHRSAVLCHLGNIAMERRIPLRWDPHQERFPEDELANRMCQRAARPT